MALSCAATPIVDLWEFRIFIHSERVCLPSSCHRFGRIDADAFLATLRKKESPWREGRLAMVALPGAMRVPLLGGRWLGATRCCTTRDRSNSSAGCQSTLDTGTVRSKRVGGRAVRVVVATVKPPHVDVFGVVGVELPPVLDTKALPRQETRKVVCSIGLKVRSQESTRGVCTVSESLVFVAAGGSIKLFPSTDIVHVPHDNQQQGALTLCSGAEFLLCEDPCAWPAALQ